MIEDNKITDLRDRAKKNVDHKMERFLCAIEDMSEQMRERDFPEHHIEQMMGTCIFIYIERNKL